MIAANTAACIRHAQIEEWIVTTWWSMKIRKVQAAGVIQIYVRINSELGFGEWGV